MDGLAVADGDRREPTTGASVDDGEPLERVPAVRLFAYGWLDNHGEEAFYRG